MQESGFEPAAIGFLSLYDGTSKKESSERCSVAPASLLPLLMPSRAVKDFSIKAIYQYLLWNESETKRTVFLAVRLDRQFLLWAFEISLNHPLITQSQTINHLFHFLGISLAPHLGAWEDYFGFDLDKLSVNRAICIILQ